MKKLGLLAASIGIPSLGADAMTRKTDARKRQSRIPVDDRWEVVVAGGGPAGCAAAISAAREGAKVLLIEATGQLGGMGTAGMVPAWCPFSDGQKIIYRGLAEKIFNESKKGVPHEGKGKLDWVHIEPEHLMRVYDRMVTDAGVQVLFFSRVAAVEMKDAETVEDVAAWSGASFQRGDSDGVVQSSSLCFAVADVDTYRYNTGPSLHTSNRNSPVYKAISSGRYPLVHKHLCSNLIGPDVVHFNAGHLDNVDSTDPWAVSEAMMTGRQTALQYTEAMREFHPKAFGSSFLVKTAPLLGVRDSRRIEGDYIFTVQDWLDRKRFDDEIGRNCYYIDVHKEGHKATRYKKGESHGIPYRCLTPKGKKNLLVAGRCISTDVEASGSLRVMPPCLVTGEAAGMAAVHAIRQTGNDVHKIDVDFLRKRLKEEGQYFL